MRFVRVRLNTHSRTLLSVLHTYVPAVLEIRRESGSGKSTPEWKQRGFEACLSPLQVSFLSVNGLANR